MADDRKNYNHGEAFCLMLYQSEKTLHVIDIWNSRDGVTPFGVEIDGEPYHHINFRFDRRMPDFRPKPGMYIFRTATRADAEAVAERVIRLRGVPDGVTREEFAAAIIDGVLHNGEGPWLEKVAEPRTEVASA